MPTKANHEQKLQAVINFIHILIKELETGKLSEDRIEEVDNQINHFRNNSVAPQRSAQSELNERLDRDATRLWNLSTRLKRDSHGNRKLYLVRVFAFFLLDSAQPPERRTTDNTIRLMKVAMKTARVCLDEGQLELCQKVMERAASYESEMHHPNAGAAKGEEEFAGLCAKLRAEYFVLRTALAWKQGRLDIAQHMFSKAQVFEIRLEPSTAENVADLLYEMGKDLLTKRQPEAAVKWLERSYNILTEQDMERLSTDAGDLRLSIMHSLVRALLAAQERDGGAARARAWDLVNLMETDFGEKTMITSLLKLDLLSSEEAFEAEKYHSVLNRMLRAVHMTESNFNTIIHHIHKLRTKDPSIALRTLDNFLKQRLYAEKNDVWLEKAFITRLWLGMQPECEQGHEAVEHLMDDILTNVGRPLSSSATHAAQTLLWKRIESTYTAGRYDESQHWCRLARHQIFSNAGELNVSKIARKNILCALGQSDPASAREAFYEMLEQGKAAPLTRFLMYKVALRDGDAVLGMVYRGRRHECLDLVCKGTSKDATLLYACVLEAQQTGDKRQAVAALQKVLQKYDYGAPKGVHLPALLRCTTRLLFSELTPGSHPDPTVAAELCKIFEGAATQATRSIRHAGSDAPDIETDFTSAELDWFARNSYNFLVKYLAELNPDQITKLVHACIQLLDLSQRLSNDEELHAIVFRRLICNYVGLTINIDRARNADVVKDKDKYYSTVHAFASEVRRRRDKRNAVDGRFPESLGGEDMDKRYSEALLCDFEAAKHLEVLHDMESIVEESEGVDVPGHHERLCDLLLAAAAENVYQKKILAMLQTIINHSWRKKHLDLTKLARWIRCLFQQSLLYEQTMTLHTLDQALSIAKAAQLDVVSRVATDGDTEASTDKGGRGKSLGGANARIPSAYPSEELEWLATTSFNKAVDFYCVGAQQEWRSWAERALSLAEVVEDGGVLAQLLRERLSSMAWEG